MKSDDLTRLRPGPSVLLQTLPDGTSVLLDMESERYFGLDAIGTALWQAIAAGTPFEAAIGELASSYDVTADRLRVDLEELVERLIGAGLVEVADE